jgi:YggT family protein
MGALLWLISTLINLFVWALIISVALTWLVQFNIVNARNPIVNQVGNFLYRLTEPALRPFRRFIPNLGGVDISPVILILLLFFLQRLLFDFFMPAQG